VVSFVAQYARWLLRTGRPPYFIYPGASSTLGILGYVNAALEIEGQLAEGGIPRPDSIWIAVGSCGTFAGLLLGARLANLQCRIVGVRIIEEDQANRKKLARLVNRAARYLRHHDLSVPMVEIDPEEIELVDGTAGAPYACPTPPAVSAVERVRAAEGLPLETTYTGKAMAALLDHAHGHPGSRLLFIDTYSEAPVLEEGDYHTLPERFWPVFDPSHQVRCWCLRSLRSRRDPAFCWKRGPRR
jgi:D-cysteine desulfhydrase